jgi:hypothetical protein
MTKVITASEYRKSLKPGKSKKEESLQIMVAQYLKLKHPDIIFHSDVASGMKLTMGQATKNKAMQSGKGFPDMFIAKANLFHHGLFLELKHSRDEIFVKSGQLRKSEHLQRQKEVHNALWAQGYYATFACGYDDAIRIIEDYLISKETIY